MQTAIVLPNLSVIADRRKPIKRAMTYQVVLCGHDGVVIASDRLEGEHRPDGSVARGNELLKLTLGAEFAWAFSGGELARIYAEQLKEKAKEMPALDDQELLEFFKTCRQPAFQAWGQPTSDSTSRVLFVRGSKRSIFRINPVPHTGIDQFLGRGIAGQVTNKASFLSDRIYSREMSVKALLFLAAYSIRAANFFDSSTIDGLDMAVYKDPGPDFEFVDTRPYLGCMEEIESKVRRVLEQD